MHVRVCVFGQLSGTFIITAGGVPTAALPFNITSAALQAALSALPAVGNVAVSRSGPDTQLGYVWSITYLALTGNVAEPIVNFAALVGVGKSAALVQVCVPVCVPVYTSLLSARSRVCFQIVSRRTNKHPQRQTSCC
jgi:hypothetical protein